MLPSKSRWCQLLGGSIWMWDCLCQRVEDVCAACVSSERAPYQELATPVTTSVANVDVPMVRQNDVLASPPPALLVDSVLAPLITSVGKHVDVPMVETDVPDTTVMQVDSASVAQWSDFTRGCSDDEDQVTRVRMHASRLMAKVSFLQASLARGLLKAAPLLPVGTTTVIDWAPVAGDLGSVFMRFGSTVAEVEIRGAIARAVSLAGMPPEFT